MALNDTDDRTTSPCPICRRPVRVPPPSAETKERGAYPFCTERCRLVDLGRWLSGAYQIPVKETDDDEERDAGPDFAGAGRN